ncbi:Transmembrane osmosensor [Boothiomyces sp. JEL0866]|nr:Transmembrane osmosensor [Boothiomyces sp. JEL0866]
MSNCNTPRLYFGLVFFEIGWIIDLIGIALEQSDIQYRRINPIGLQWYFLFVYLFTILVFNGSLYTDTVKTYRMVLLGLTVLSLAYIPFDIDAALHMQVDVNNYLSNVSPIKVVGLIIMAVSLFLILTIFGSDDNSYFNTFRVPIIGSMFKRQPDEQEDGDANERHGNEHHRPAFDQTQNEYSSKQEYSHPHSPAQEFVPPASPRSYNQREPFRRDLDLPPPPGGSISIPIKDAERSANIPPVVPPQDLSVLSSPILRNSTLRPDLLAKFKVCARYPYVPNPTDSYQVSFHKDEIMDVVDSEGKWWQVVKSEPDGTFTTGIAPSNYLSIL